ncbi:PREDICTED: uncharacterized protein LOC108566449 [Nicrophorus vespilloides]|uniref:Uncharacterized protein LOC108566449 n=1 Tax=Nicrophorus vespilloides TaxID=110193 RepID=A0ABM1N4R4_NICVS|nr:PREDICTED: uncharacterized protein LOC108566449 [Nicrophorus vespilloides]
MYRKNVFDPENVKVKDEPETNDSIDDVVVKEEVEMSDTEQEVLSEYEDNEDAVENILFRKDEDTWKNPASNVGLSLQNIVCDLPVVKGVAEHGKFVLDCWSAFFDDDMLNLIVLNTNVYIFSKMERYKRARDCRATDLAELKAFIGLLYMAGFHKNSRLNTNDLWGTDGSGIELFRLTMSRNRFNFLLQHVRFDDTRKEIKGLDKFAPIRDIFDMFVTHCQNNYSAGQYATIDESNPEMVTFYNKTKSGVKVVDKLCATYSVARNTNRWPMVIFYNMLDVAAINAYIIYKANESKEMKNRRHFIKTLALELTREHKRNRSTIQCLPRDIRKRNREQRAENEDPACPSTSCENVRKRCNFCERKKNRMTKYRCVECDKYICLEHANYVCNVCISKEDLSS